MRRFTNAATSRCVVLAACLTLAACSADTDADPDPSEPAGTSGEDAAGEDAADDDTGDDAGAGAVVISDFTFSGLSASAGADVEVVNNDGVPHTVTAADGQFDSGSVAGGATGSFTAPAESGSYDVVCSIHSQMSGTLEVT